MSECVCSSCKNLKSQLGEEGAVEQYDCEYGFPSEECSECANDGQCTLTCSHYVCDEEEDEVRVLPCKGCGKELRKAFGDIGDDDVYCMECYLKKM